MEVGGGGRGKVGFCGWDGFWFGGVGSWAFGRGIVCYGDQTIRVRMIDKTSQIFYCNWCNNVLVGPMLVICRGNLSLPQ